MKFSKYPKYGHAIQKFSKLKAVQINATIDGHNVRRRKTPCLGKPNGPPSKNFTMVQN